MRNTTILRKYVMHSFWTSAHKSVTLKGDSFFWNRFGGVASAANQILSPFGNSCSEPQRDNPIVQHSYPQPQCPPLPLLTPRLHPSLGYNLLLLAVLESHGYVFLPFWLLILLICLGSSLLFDAGSLTIGQFRLRHIRISSVFSSCPFSLWILLVIPHLED